MTANSITSAAHTEAAYRDMDPSKTGQNNRAWFVAGAEWQAAQEPTDAEVEAVASSILLSTSGRYWEDIDEGERREYRRYARAALIRARAARQTEETW